MDQPPRLSGAAPVVYEFGPYRLDPADRRLTRGSEAIHLQPKTFDLLCALVERHGHLVTKADLMAKVWPDTFVEEGAVAVNVSLLRKALPLDDGSVPIETVPRLGYRFTAPVRELKRSPVEEAPAAALPPAVPAAAAPREPEPHPEPTREAPVAIPDHPEPPPAPPPVVTSAAPPVRSRGRLMWAAVAGGVLLASAAGLGIWWRTASSETGAKMRSLAVLPFDVLGAQEEAEHLRVAMADAITTRLATFGSIRVPPTATINYFSRQHASPTEIGRALRVDGVLTGTVQRADDRIRVTVQLSRVSDGTQVWAGRFDERLAGLFSMQDAIAEQVAPSLLATTAGGAPAPPPRRRDTENVEAYELYLKARDRANARTIESVRTAIQMYQAAIERDPRFARAYAGLADAYSTTASGLAPAVRYPLARAAAEQALALDPNLAAAHVARAFVAYKSEWAWERAERLLARAIALDPAYSFAHLQMGEMRKLLGRFDEAIADFRRVRELDPYFLHARQDEAALLVLQGRIAEAREVIEGGLRQDPNAWEMHQGLAEVLEAEGRMDEAIEHDLRSRALAGQPAAELEAMRAAYRRGGKAAYLRQENEFLMARLEDEAEAPKGLASSLAKNSALLGDREAALHWVHVATERGEEGPLYLNYPFYDFVQDDRRFQALHERVFGDLPRGRQ